MDPQIPQVLQREVLDRCNEEEREAVERWFKSFQAISLSKLNGMSVARGTSMSCPLYWKLVTHCDSSDVMCDYAPPPHHILRGLALSQSQASPWLSNLQILANNSSDQASACSPSDQQTRCSIAWRLRQQRWKLKWLKNQWNIESPRQVMFNHNITEEIDEGTVTIACPAFKRPGWYFEYPGDWSNIFWYTVHQPDYQDTSDH